LVGVVPLPLDVPPVVPVPLVVVVVCPFVVVFCVDVVLHGCHMNSPTARSTTTMTAATIGVELPEELEERSTMRVPSDECDLRLAYPRKAIQNPG
jgi:hypothetical protein